MRPKSRDIDLIVKRLDDEILIYDLASDRAHSLNGTAKTVFELCDGTRDVRELVECFAQEHSIETEPAMAIVTTALEQLRRLVKITCLIL